MPSMMLSLVFRGVSSLGDLYGRVIRSEWQIDNDRALFPQQTGVDTRLNVGCLQIGFARSDGQRRFSQGRGGQLGLGKQIFALGGKE